jgi:hypothetical protein
LPLIASALDRFIGCLGRLPAESGQFPPPIAADSVYRLTRRRARPIYQQNQPITGRIRPILDPSLPIRFGARPTIMPSQFIGSLDR